MRQEKELLAMDHERAPQLRKEHLEFFKIDMTSGWVEIAPGIHAKTVAGSTDDESRQGHMNRLVRWAPHAKIDAIRSHEFYEEVFVLDGSLWVASQDDPEAFTAFDAYSFACRPPNAKHGPFKAGETGCVLFETQFYW
jgi:hypothetical protein